MKRKLFLLGALALMVAGGVFWSCQKDDVLQIPDGVMLKSATSNYPASCDDVCIDLSLETVIYYKKSGSFNGTIGGNSKTIGYTVYNTEDHFVVELSYSRMPESSNSSSTIKVTADGEEKTATIANGGSDKLEFPLQAGWAGCDEVEWSLEETAYDGGQIIGGGTYELIGICGDCEESFDYKENEDGTYTFIYVPAEDLDDAELVFTFPQGALDGDPIEDWTYNGQTMQTTMSLTACTPYEWTVSLSCKDLTNPQNKWTDFKVKNVSKKGNLDNIKCD